MIEVNSSCPNFVLQGIDKEGNEKTYTLTDFKDKNIILYFYPKDNTSGCTQEACDFRDSFNRLTNKTIVVGVSPDSIKSHKNFQTKQSLNFTLISDPEHQLAEALGVWGEKKMYGKSYMGIIRSSFLIDDKGIIKKVWKNVKVKGHVEEILKSID